MTPKATPCTKYVIRHRLLRLVHPFFVQLTLLPNPNTLCFTTFFNLPDAPKVPLPVRASYIAM